MMEVSNGLKKSFPFHCLFSKKCHYDSEGDGADCPGKEEMEIAECGGVDRHFTGDQHCGEEPCHEVNAD